MCVRNNVPNAYARRGGCPALLRTVLMLALLLSPLAAAEADAVLRFPSQSVYEIVETGTSWNERSVAAQPGQTLRVHFDVRVVGANTLTQNQTYVIEWRLDDRLIGTLNGTLEPGAERQPGTFEAIMPDDPGDHTLRMTLITGAWDPTPGNNDPPTTLLRLGDVRGFTPDQGSRHPYLGPALMGALALVLLPLRWPQVRSRIAEVGRPASERLESLRVAWPHIDAGHKRRIATFGIGLALASLLASMVVARGRLVWMDDPTGALAIATLVFAVPAAVRLARRHWTWSTFAVWGWAFACAVIWQQGAALTPFLRWPALGELTPFVVNGITVGALYALLALGYTMVYGVLKFINFAHGDVFVWGGYLGWLLVVQYPLVGLPLAILWAIIATAGLGALIERVAYRPLRGGDRLSPLITAIAVSLLLASMAQFLFGAQSRTFKEAGSTYTGSVWQELLTQDIQLGPIRLSSLDATILVVSILLLVALQWFISRSRTGQAMRAVADDQEAALTVGIPVDRIVTWTFVIGSGLAAVGGVFWGLRFSLRPTLGLLTGIKAFTAAVVGGIGNIPGAFLGGFLIGLAENVGGQFIDSRFQNVIAFVILVGFLLVRPQGMFGKEVKRR